MNDYLVTMTLSITFPIAAPNEDVARTIAYEYWDETEPEIIVEVVTKEDEIK